MPEELVLIKELLPRDKILEIPILGEVAEDYGRIPPEPSRTALALQEIFFQTFASEVGSEDLAGLLSEVAVALANLPEGQLSEPVTHPSVDNDPSLKDRHPAFGKALDVVLRWLVDRVVWGWIRKEGVNIPAGHDHGMPWWFFYSFVEMGRIYLRDEPDAYDRPVRARAFVRAVNKWTDWRRVVPLHHGLEQVEIPQMTMTRWPGESRDEFALRIAMRVLNWSLKRIADQALANAAVIEALGWPQMSEKELRGELDVRAGELARRMLGKEIGSRGGSSLAVHIHYATLLGFLRPTRGS
ncbi:hypothetical protein ACFL3S_05375 [Gemmatimonadota bacterium]